MRRLLNLLAAFCLFAAFANGAVLHAAELAVHDPTAAEQWLHFDGDADQVPADTHSSFPHHHGLCPAYELAMPVDLCGTIVGLERETLPIPAHDELTVTDPPSRNLRPPIA